MFWGAGIDNFDKGLPKVSFSNFAVFNAQKRFAIFVYDGAGCVDNREAVRFNPNR